MNPSSLPPAEALARIAREPAALLLDVRSPAEFRELRAEPAQNLPLPDVSAKALASLGHRAGDAVYVLCQSGKRAEAACRRLAGDGVPAVVVEGGTEAWAAAGLPVVRGARAAIGLERQVRIGAGALVLLGVVLSVAAHPGFVWLAGFVGAGLVFAGLTGFCGMGLLLARAPWNR